MSNEALKVFKKEAREMLRDKRVRSSAILGPFLLVFMMMYSFGSLMDSIGNKSKTRIYIVKSPVTSLLEQRLKGDGKDQGATIIPVNSVEEGRALISSGRAPLVIDIPMDFDASSTAGQTTTINAYYDQREERSQIALSALKSAVEEMNKDQVGRLLKIHNLPESYAAPIQVHPESVSKPSGVSQILIAILPYLIIFWAFIGGVSAAADLVAGEKERNTLETLLITPVPRTKIVWGKFLSLASLCMMSSLSGLAAVFVAANSHMKGMDKMFEHGTGLGLVTLGGILLVLVPTVCFFASVLIAISTFAKNSREAQTYLSLASLAVAFPAISSQFIGFTDMASAKWINLIPVLNASASVRAAMLGNLDTTSLLMTTGTSVVLAIIGITVAVKMFNREQVLLRV